MRELFSTVLGVVLVWSMYAVVHMFFSWVGRLLDDGDEG